MSFSRSNAFNMTDTEVFGVTDDSALLKRWPMLLQQRAATLPTNLCTTRPFAQRLQQDSLLEAIPSSLILSSASSQTKRGRRCARVTGRQSLDKEER